jgi:hypothetical protein
MTHFDTTNESGMFRVSFGRQFYYNFAGKNEQVSYPIPLNSVWKEKAETAAVNVLSIPATRAQTASGTGTDNQIVPTSNGLPRTTDNEQSCEPPNKIRRVDENSSGSAGAAGTSCLYWPDTPEACCYVFKSMAGEGTAETPQEAVERQIRLVQSVHEREDSWRNVVVGRDDDNYCTKAEIVEIGQRSTFLCLAYQLAIEHLNRWKWQGCCREACKRLNSLGMTQATSFKTVAEWNAVFRNLESFPHRNLYVQCGKRPLPRLLEIYPDAKDQIISFGVKNLALLTIEGIHDFIVSIVTIPRLACVWQEDQKAATSSANTSRPAISTTVDGNIETAVDSIRQEEGNQELTSAFLKAHGLESISLTTAWHWMRLLNFKYDARKRTSMSKATSAMALLRIARSCASDI